MNTWRAIAKMMNFSDTLYVFKNFIDVKKKKEKKISLKSSWFTMLSLTSPIQQSDSVDLVLISLWRKFPILSLSIVLDPFVECSSLDTSYLYSSYIYPPSKIAPSNCFVFLFNIHEIFETLFTSVLWFSAKSTTSKFIRYAMCGWIFFSNSTSLGILFSQLWALGFIKHIVLQSSSVSWKLCWELCVPQIIFSSRYGSWLIFVCTIHFSNFTANSMITWVACHFSSSSQEGNSV